MTDYANSLPEDVVNFKAPDLTGNIPVLDVAKTPNVEVLDFDVVKKEVGNYQGEGFEKVEKVEDLTLAEYLQRLKADQGRYLGNIVHQGVRDHLGMEEHSTGLGEYDRELELIIESGGLISAIEKTLKNQEKLNQAAIEVRKKIADGLTIEEALNQYLFETYQADRDELQGMTDDLAIHVSTNYIVDSAYGAETGNESFIIFPERVGLKGKIFFGRSSDTHVSRETQYNDVYIWPENEEPNEMGINGAIIFLPRDNQVGKKTGSTYEVENGKAVLDIEQIERLFANAGKIVELRPPVWMRTKSGENIVVSFEELLKNHFIEVDSIHGYRVTYSGKEVMDQKFWDKFDLYIKAILEAGFSDVQRFDAEIYRYPINLASERDQILTGANEQDVEVIKRLLDTFLSTVNTSDIGKGFEAFLNPKDIKISEMPRIKEFVRQAGFDPVQLEEVFARNNKEAIFSFFQKYLNIYKALVHSSHGNLYKRPAEAVKSKDYYDKLIRERLTDVKVTITTSDRQDIVEYRGINKLGKSEVLRVVFYSSHNPNKAVEGLYHDLKVNFDSTILGQNGVDNVNFSDVQYHHDLDRLKEKISEKVNMMY